MPSSPSIRTHILATLVITLLALPLIGFAAGPPAGTIRDKKEIKKEKEAEVSPHKWLYKIKGYDKALALQQETGADIFIYFKRYLFNDEKGLCRWFEKRGLSSGPVRECLRDYIKVEVELSSNKKSKALIEKFRIGKCPTVYVIQPSGRKNRVQVFNWNHRPPRLLRPFELADLIRSKSTPKKPDSDDTE